MKFGLIILMSVITAGCGALTAQQPVVQDTFFTPVIQSDVSSSGYTPSVTTPAPAPKKSTSRIYTPVLR